MNWDRNIPDNETACVTFLAEIRWPKGFQCSCGSSDFYRLKSRPRVFECKVCKAQKSVTAGTLMHGTRVPLRTWFVAVVLMARPNGLTAAELQRRTDVHYDTAWQILHRLRGGLQEAKIQLRSPVTAGRYFVYFQGAWKSRFRKDPQFRSLVTYLIVDEQGTMAVTFHQLGPWPFRDMIKTHAPHLKTLPPIVRGLTNPAVKLGIRLKDRLQKVHQSVSVRWMRAYLMEFATSISLPKTFAEDLLKGALHTAATSFTNFKNNRWYTAEQERWVTVIG